MNPQAQTQQFTRSEKIAERIDKNTTSQLGIAAGGNLDFANLTQIMEVAKVVATSAIAIPGHLRDNPGACLAVCIQASEWRMSPFAVANKSYVVNDRMAYEAQLIASVILMRAPIKDQFIDYVFEGEGMTRKCTCICTLNSGREVKHSSPEVGKIKVKNSPLWVGDPDQQLGYYTVRAMARRYFPHIILGVYTPEEMAENTRDVTPTPTFTQDPLGALPQGTTTEKVEPEPEPETAPVGKPQAQPSGNGEGGEASAKDGAKTPTPPATGTIDQQPDDRDRQTLLADLEVRMKKDGIGAKTVKAFAFKNNLVPAESIMTKDYSVEVLQALDERWEEITGGQ